MIKAKFRCDTVTRNSYEQEIVALWPVYSSNPNDVNHSWSKATPSGRLELTISNTAAHGFFNPGQEYVLSIEPAAPAVAA